MKAGKVRISDELILEWLDFQGGKIVGANKPFGIVGVVDIIIEHDDMPTVRAGDTIPISPTCFVSKTNEYLTEAIIAKRRTNPPKNTTSGL